MYRARKSSATRKGNTEMPRLMQTARDGAVTALLLLGVSASVRASDEIDKLVARNLSPGVVGLLARHSKDTRAASRLRAGILDKTAPVRLAAARVLAVGRMVDLLPDLREALGRETDAGAAREEILALCALGGPAADGEALAAVRRFAPRLDGAYARTLARLRGTEALPFYFSTPSALVLSPWDRRVFFRHVANHDGAEVLAAAGSLALSHRSAEDWQAVLAVAAEREAPLQEGVLVAALRGEDMVLRGEAAWYMAKSYRKKLPQRSEEILRAVSDNTAPSADAELRFGVEMLRRVLGKPAEEDEGWIACLETNPECHLDSDFEESPLIELLTARERVALLRRNEANKPPEARWSLIYPGRRGARTPAASPTPRPETDRSELRLVTGLPSGMTSDLLSVAGCRSSVQKRWFSIAEIEYAPSGLPGKVALLGVPTSSDCQTAAETIFLMSAAPEDRALRQRRGVYLALFEPDCLICNEQAAVPSGGPSPAIMRVRAKVVPPKLIKKTEPIYPEDARRQHQEGVSVYEAVISSSGCVRELHLVKSSHPILDVSGMEGIAHWRYKPATLDERPVSVYLTVTVTYNLKS